MLPPAVHYLKKQHGSWRVTRPWHQATSGCISTKLWHSPAIPCSCFNTSEQLESVQRHCQWAGNSHTREKVFEIFVKFVNMFTTEHHWGLSKKMRLKGSSEGVQAGGISSYIRAVEVLRWRKVPAAAHRHIRHSSMVRHGLMEYFKRAAAVTNKQPLWQTTAKGSE